MMKIARPTLAAVAALGMVFGAASLAGVATTPAAAQQAPEAGEAPMVDDETLRSFAVAALEIRQINETYQPQFEAAQSPEEQREIAMAADAEMVRAVENVPGIDVDQYNLIAQAARDNPQIMQQINTLVMEESAR